jgi:plastocyanin
MRMRLPARWRCGSTRKGLVRGLVIAVLWSGAHVVQAAPPCGGDCDGDGAVAVTELIKGVNIALGAAPITQCNVIDANGDQSVTVNELVSAVNNALGSCPTFVGTYSGSVELDAGQRATLALTTQADGSAGGTVSVLNARIVRRAAGDGGAAASFSIAGSVDLDTGSFSVNGTYPDGSGRNVPVNVAGALPVRPGATGRFEFHLGPDTYTGSITSGSVAPVPTPTATPTPPGTGYVVKVGQSNLPFDPELLEINVGDTVQWTWVGGAHWVVSNAPGVPGVPHCAPDGRFASAVQSSGTFSFTFTAPGEYEYHCGVAGHCEAFESGIIVVRGTPTPTVTRTPTVPPTPTVTPTPATVGGVSTGMLGVFSGHAVHSANGARFPIRFEIRVDGTVILTELPTEVGNVLGGGTFVMTVQSPTRLVYSLPDPLDPRSLTLQMVEPGHITGAYGGGSMGMSTFTMTLDLQREG